MDPAVALPLWAEYVRALAPAGTLLVGVPVALIAWRSHVRQKRADRHAALWESMIWAVAQISESDDIYRARMGMSVLTALADDALITPRDFRMLSEINQIVVERVIAHDFEEDAADDDSDDELPKDRIDDER